MPESQPHRPPARRTVHLALWTLQWVLGLSLVTAGAVKLLLPAEMSLELFPWAADIGALFPVTAALDVLGGVGLVAPALTRVLPRLTVLAALGVAALMAAAVVFYVVRGEAAEIVVNVVLGILALAVAAGRQWLAPLTGQLPDPARWSEPLPAATPPAEMALFQLPTGTYSTPAVLAVRGGGLTETRRFAATAVLVQHPAGDLLLDAGFGGGASEHIASLPAFRRSAHHLGATASTQLDAAGYDRARLRGVVLTHSHWDHVSGLDSLDVPVWMPAAEHAYALAAKDDRVFAHVARDHEIREYGFDGPPYLGFPASFDVHGDGSVVIVPAGGHTDGSVIVFVALPSGARYAFIGDLTWQLDGVTRRVERPLLMRLLADSDAAQVRRDLGKILALEEFVQVVPAHDAEGYAGIPLLDPAARSIGAGS